MKIAQFFSQMTKTQSEGVKIGNSTTLSNVVDDTSTPIQSEQQQKINRLLSKYNVSSDSETQKGIQDFFKSAEGSDQSKLDTLETALSKGITPSKDNLTALHSALNETALTSEQVDMLATENAPSAEETNKVIEALKLPDKIKAVLKAMVAEGYSLKEASALLSKFLGGKTSGQNPISALIATIQTMDPESLNTLLQKNISSNTALSQVDVYSNVTQSVESFWRTNGDELQDQISPSSNQTIESKEGSISPSQPLINTGEAIESFKEARNDLESLGEKAMDDPIRALKAHLSQKNEIASASNEGSVETGELTDGEPLVDTYDGESDQAFFENFQDLVTTALGQISQQLSEIESSFELKQYLVQETTQMGIEMKAQFNDFKSEVLNQFKAALEAPESATEDLVAKAIETIDKMITRKEVTMYATMQTERDLLVTSSELKEASNLLQAGKVNEAMAIVEKAQDTVKNLYFEPDQKRVQLFVTQKVNSIENMMTDSSDSKALKLQNILSQLQDQDGVHHARDVVETLRFMGTNHESEVVSAMEGREKTEEHALIKENIKEILIKMSKEEGEQRQVTSTEKSLMNLAGQQMMNDRQQDGKRPFYFFNYPIQEADDINEMKVYVSGNQSQSKIDWQNSELYFGVTLNALGDAGIKVKVTDGNLEINVRNDEYNSLVGAISQYVDQLETMGFKSVNIKGTSFTQENALKSVSDIDFDGGVKRDEDTGLDGKVDYKV